MRGRLLILGIASTLALVLVFAAPAAGAAPPTEEINQTYGGTDDDGINEIIPTDDGNYLLIGLDNQSPGEAAVRKINPNGTVLWKRTYGGDNTDTFWDGFQTNDGGFILAGWTNTSGTEDLDGWVVKINSSGDKLWEKSYGGNNSDWFEGIEKTPDGDLLLVGGTISDDNGQDAWVVKTTSEGRTIWSFVYWHTDQAGPESFNAIERTPSETYLIAGEEYAQSGEHWNGWAFEIDENGEILWSEQFGHSILNDWFEDVDVSDSGQAYFVGARNAVWNSTKDEYEFADGWVVTANGSRGVSWRMTYSVSDYNDFHAVDTVSNQVLVSGNAMDISGDRDGLVTLLNTDGSELWNATLGGSKYEDFDAAHIDSEKNYYVAGETESIGSGGWDGWLVKLASQNQEATSTLQAIAGDDNKVDFGDVLQAISAFNTGSTIDGHEIGFNDVLDAISAFNTGEEVN